MADIDWKELLGWGNTQIQDLQFAGYTYAKEGKYDIALTIFHGLSVLEPQSSYNLKTLGAIQLQIGQNIEALNTLEKALKLDPESFEIRLNRVKALYALGYRDQGTQEAKALMHSPNATIANTATALNNSYT